MHFLKRNIRIPRWSRECSVLSIIFLGSAQIFAQNPAPPLEPPLKVQKGPLPLGGQETLLGILVMAEIRKSSVVTDPFPPILGGRSFPGGPAAISEGQPNAVTSEKGSVLVVLHFTLHRDPCAFLDRQRIVLRESKKEEGRDAKSYAYGAFSVDQRGYHICGSRLNRTNESPHREQGPWDNVLWTPMGVAPDYSNLDLIFQVSQMARGLVFTDGLNEIDLDPLLLPKEAKKDKRKNP